MKFETVSGFRACAGSWRAARWFMARDKAYIKNGRKLLEIAILIAGAVVMTAAVLDVASGAEKPAIEAVEREVIPGAERMTAAERDAYRRRMQGAATQ